MTTLGERLRKARKRKGMSQMDVFDAVGISNKSLSRYEKDDSAPSPEVLMRLSRLYDVSSEYILGLTTVMGHSSDTPQDGENLIDMTDNKASAQKLINFISASPTMFHAVENVSQKLINEGYTRLNEWEDWQIERGGKYFTTRNGSSVIAFKVGEGDPSGFNIFSAHTDSPLFKLKPNAEMETLGHYIRLNTERYGGMILPSWFDRPLSIAGRAVVNSGGAVKTVLVSLSDVTVIIPNVAIHMNHATNDGYSYNPQVDTIPLFGSEISKGSLMKKVAETAGVKEKDILSTELYLYNKTDGAIWGAGGEYVSCPRLDNMQSVYAGLQGFLTGGHPDTVSVYCAFDNEEVGSATKQGANSDFFLTVTERVCEKLGKSKPEMLAQSFCVSADSAHAVHPNHPEFADPTNTPYMNGGIVVKHTARQSYATDAVSDAVFRKICAAIAVPVQTFTNRSNMMGGGTLGNISATRVSVSTVDIGLALLAMHSSYETGGSMDTLYLERAAAELYRTKIIRTPDGGYELK